MARPKLLPKDIAAQGAHWDSTVDQNFAAVKDTLTIKPFPMPLAHVASASEDSILLSTLDPALYSRCYLHLVDAASPSTNGYLIYSNGSTWKYVKSETAV